jgi:hypothetical protein
LKISTKVWFPWTSTVQETRLFRAMICSVTCRIVKYEVNTIDIRRLIIHAPFFAIHLIIFIKNFNRFFKVLQIGKGFAICDISDIFYNKVAWACTTVRASLFKCICIYCPFLENAKYHFFCYVKNVYKIRIIMCDIFVYYLFF